MRMLLVTTGMYVPFVAPSLTRRRCPYVTSVGCNIVARVVGVAQFGVHWGLILIAWGLFMGNLV